MRILISSPEIPNVARVLAQLLPDTDATVAGNTLLISADLDDVTKIAVERAVLSIPGTEVTFDDTLPAPESDAAESAAESEIEAAAELPTEPQVDIDDPEETHEDESPSVPFTFTFETTEARHAFCRAAAGRVVFAEPPTGGEPGAWTVSGTTRNLDEVSLLAQ